MSGYSISCTTCKARLKIPRADLVGKIVACPKCGSMVLITPPPPVESPAAAVSAAAAPAAAAPTAAVSAAAAPAAAVSAAAVSAAAVSAAAALVGPPPLASPIESPPAARLAGEQTSAKAMASAAPVTPFDDDFQLDALAPPAAPPVAAPPVAGAHWAPPASPPSDPTRQLTPASDTAGLPAGGAPTASTATTVTTATAAETTTPVAPPVVTAQEPPTAPGLPTADPVAAPASAASLALWVGGGVGGGLLLAFGIFFTVAWLRMPDTPPVASGSNSNSTATAPDGGLASATPGATPSDSQPATTPPATAPSTTAATNPPAAESPLVSQPANTPAVATQSPTVQPPIGQAPATQPATAQTAPPNPLAPQVAAGTPAVATIDAPPGFQPRPGEAVEAAALPGPGVVAAAGKAGIGDAVGQAADQPLAGPVGKGPLANPSPIAGRFARLFGEGIADATTPSTIATNPSQPAKLDVLAMVPTDAEIRRPRPREIDLAARLADPLEKLRVKEMPLLDFARFMTDLSTVPVTLDADALRVRRLSPLTPVSVDVEQSTVQGVWQAALAPLQLGLEPGEGQVRITDLSMLGAAPRQRMHDVADLTGGDAERTAALGRWIRELVMPGTWTEDGGTGRLVAAPNGLSIEHRELAQHQVLFLCDKLRVARKLPPRGKFPSELLAVASVPSRAKSPLATPIQLNFHRLTRMTQILERLGAAAGVTILIDWTALQSQGWTPETMAVLAVEGKSLAEALTLLLGPRELTYRAVDDRTLEVTTSAALAGHIEWELYPIRDLLGAEGEPSSVIDQLRDVIAADKLELPALDMAFRYDPPSGTVLAALPEPHHRLLASWLADRRAAAPARAVSPVPGSAPARASAPATAP